MKKNKCGLCAEFLTRSGPLTLGLNSTRPDTAGASFWPPEVGTGRFGSSQARAVSKKARTGSNQPGNNTINKALQITIQYKFQKKFIIYF